MDIAKAFTFVTEDERLLTKLGIAVLVSVASFLIVPIPLLVGYMVGVTRNVRDGVKKPLPEWDDFGQLFRDGLSVIAAQLVYTLPFWLIACIAFIATIGFGGLAEASEEAAAAGIIATFGLIGCLTVLFAIALLFISPAIVLQYVNTNELGACFRFSEVIGIARQNMGDILIVFLASFGAGLVLSVVTTVLGIIPCLGPILALIISFAASPYFLFATGHMYGQIAAKISGKGLGTDF